MTSPIITLDNFDPNQLPGVWATVVINYAQNGFAFKTYTKRQGALNKVRGNANSALFAWDLGLSRWVEVARHPRGLPQPGTPCDRCGVPIGHDPTLRDTGAWEWERGPARKIVERPRLLWVCRRCFSYMNGWGI